MTTEQLEVVFKAVTTTKEVASAMKEMAATLEALIEIKSRDTNMKDLVGSLVALQVKNLGILGRAQELLEKELEFNRKPFTYEKS